jgi:hypothetical protein
VLRQQASGKCDFCSAPDPEWIYPTRDFNMAAMGWGSVGAWAACDACSALIEARDYRELRERGMAASGSAEGLPDDLVELLKDAVDKLHAKFRRERKGPRMAFG